MNTEKIIYVYAAWESNDNKRIGQLFVNPINGKEVFSFEYDKEWLDQNRMVLDPDISLYRGRQYLPSDKTIFGMFADSCPDRWGRLLMKRREAIRAKKSGEKPHTLFESDCLLGVHDEARMGGLRFKLDAEGEFLATDTELSTPPWITLRELEMASISFEKDESGLNEKWLNQLLAPGSSLGGARPKATVKAPDNSLWIAKFPSNHDDWNMGAWEMVTHDLAELCNLDVPEAKLETFSKEGSTYLVKRFDRNKECRIHFSSAMTLLGKVDGASAADGNSYIEIVSFIKANSINPKRDLQELWKRIVFSMAVSNTDDHLRNHGFMLNSEGWSLSPMYDVNPTIYGKSLSLNVDEYNADLDYSVAIGAAEFYELSKNEAKRYVEEISSTVTENWKRIAINYGLSRGEILKMEPAFNLKYNKES